MAISTPTNVAAVTGGSVSNASSYDTAATILTAGRLYRLAVVTYKSSTPAIPTTVTHAPTGTPLSFTLVTAGGTDASVVSWDSAAHRSLSVWQVVPGSTTASAVIRITGMGTCSSCGWSLTEITSGFDATTPTAQVKVASGLQTSAIAVTMGSFADSNNLTTLVMGWGDGTANPAETIVATESRTELEEHNDGERSSLGSDYQNPNGGDTTIGATLSASTVDWACIGIETAAAITSFTATAALTVVPAVAAASAETFTGTAALTITPSEVASGTEQFSGSAPLTITPAVVAAGTETFTGTAPTTITPAIVASGSVSGAPVSGTAALTIVPSVVASGTETFSAIAALTIVPSEVAAGTETFTGAAPLTIVPEIAASGTVSGVGITGTAALVIVPVIAASATEAFSGAGALTLAPSLVGAGVELFTSSAVLAPNFSLAASGTAVSAGDREGTVALVVPVEILARGRVRPYHDPAIADYIRLRLLGGGREG